MRLQAQTTKEKHMLDQTTKETNKSHFGASHCTSKPAPIPLLKLGIWEAKGKQLQWQARIISSSCQSFVVVMLICI
jgi:hypothetical protein